jgi:hypothetical protein
MIGSWRDDSINLQREKKLKINGFCCSYLISAPHELWITCLLPRFSIKRFSSEFFGLTAGSKQHIRRPIHKNIAGGNESQDHKGFNWKYLNSLIEKNL